MLVMWSLALIGCSEYGLGTELDRNDPDFVDPDGEAGGHATRDTDGDGIVDSEDPDADGDGVINPLDPDPDGDGEAGWTLDDDPSDDPVLDNETDLPELVLGSVRGRICAPNGSTWVAGATVQIITPFGIFETESNGDGWWQIDGLPPGEYTALMWKGHFSRVFQVTVSDGEINEDIYEECVEQGQVRVAVVTGEYDSIGAVLAYLGVEFDTVNGRNDSTATDFLTDPSALGEYDLIFFNCGMSFAWLENDSDAVRTNLREFVAEGGSIYASDWAYLMVETPFPDAITFMGDDNEPGNAFRGLAEEIDAIVVDQPMADLLGGNSARINYDLNQWVPLEVVHQGDVLLSGEFPYLVSEDTADRTSAPLAARFTHGSGKVTFTSFHNEVQTTVDMERLLEDIVLSL